MKSDALPEQEVAVVLLWTLLMNSVDESRRRKLLHGKGPASSWVTGLYENLNLIYELARVDKIVFIVGQVSFSHFCCESGLY